MSIATINNRVLLFGKLSIEMKQIKWLSLGGEDGDNREEILEFNYGTESWTKIGEMTEPRIIHAVSVVSFEDYEQWCVPESNTTPWTYLV